MYCHHCGKELSDEAFMCPDCGTPTGNNTQKKFVEKDSEGGSKSRFTAIACFVLSAIAFLAGIVELSISLAAEAYSVGLLVVVIGGLGGVAFGIHALCAGSAKENSTMRLITIIGLALAGFILFYDFIATCVALGQYL